MLIICTSCTLKSNNPRAADNLPAPVATPPTPPSNYSEGGVGNTGGGNSDSKHRKIILDYLKNDALALKTDLIQWLKEFKQFRAQGVMSARIHKMIDSGLIEDIQKTKFVPADSCTDITGTSKSMSTRKVDNFKDTMEHPDICINIPKLGAENATYEDIIGNLMHEYGRHFGFEDTEKFGIHPMAYYVTNLFKAGYFTRNLVTDMGKPSMMEAQQPDLYVARFSGNVSHMIYAPLESKVIFQVTPVRGDCSNFKILTWGELIKADGQVIQDKMEVTGSKDPAFFAGINVGPIMLRTVLVSAQVPYFGNIILQFEKAETCRVNLKVQITPNKYDVNVTSSAEIKNLGVLGNNNILWLIFYPLDLRDFE
jgi:hypothetical protein